MARKKRRIKAKEPVRIRFKRLANGNQSIYLDRYADGKRSYEFLKMYLVPETDEISRAQNENTMRAAVAIKSQRVNEIVNGKAGLRDAGAVSRIPFVVWFGMFMERKTGDGYKRIDILRTVRNLLSRYGGTQQSGTLTRISCLAFRDGSRTTTERREGEYCATTVSACT